MKRTEMDILLALNRLIARMDMEKITTEKIVEEAKISRATFYRYFKDKYDVLNRNYKELLDGCGLPGEIREILPLFLHVGRQ